MSLRRRTPLRAKGRPRHKHREQDPVYLAWIRGLPCTVALHPDHTCRGRTEAHHVTSRGRGGSDYDTVPLCTQAHIGELHTWGKRTFATRYEVDLVTVADSLRRQYLEQ